MLKSSIITALISSFFALPTLAQSIAFVSAPPSNIRNRPNGEIICTVTKRVSLNIYQQEGEWYYTDVCGGGYIHQSQIRLSANFDASHLTDRAKVVELKQGQLALRDAPNGKSLAGLNNGNIVQILAQHNNWAYVQVISGPNAQINGMKGWVNSHYLALF